MIFPAIIALFFGLVLATFELVLFGRLGALFGGLLIAVFAFLGSQRLAHRKSRVEMTVGAVATLLPVWLVPYYGSGFGEYAGHVPALAIITVAVLGGVLLTAWAERKKLI